MWVHVVCGYLVEEDFVFMKNRSIYGYPGIVVLARVGQMLVGPFSPRLALRIKWQRGLCHQCPSILMILGLVCVTD